MKKGDIISREYEVEGEPAITLTAIVNWVVGEDAGISLLSPPSWKGTSDLIMVGEWKVIEESVPTYQSAVAQMSDEELRKSIDLLRRSRVNVPPKARRIKEDPISNDPIARLLEKMDPEKKRELMRKLGMIGENDV